MDCSPKTDELEIALEKFQETSGFVKATKENPYHKNKYANYNMVVADTRKDLKLNGLRVKQAVINIDGKAGIWTRLSHTSGQWMISESPCAYKDGDPQAQGSAITYMKRYAYAAILDLLIDADDDGNLAAGVGEVADKKQQTADFYAEKAALTKYLTKEKGMTIPSIGALVERELKKPRIETMADIEKIKTALAEVQ